MYSLALILLVAGAVCAAPQVQYRPQPQVAVPRPILIVKQISDNNFDGTFSSDFETENGIASQASGYVKAISPKEQAQVMQGQYSYTTPDGVLIVTRWYADESGFHAEGDHIPKIPEAIAKSLAYLASLPPQPAPQRVR